MTLEPAALLPALLAGAAAMLVVRRPGGALHRLELPVQPSARPARGLGQLIAGRADAPPLRRRLLWGAALATALCLAARSGLGGAGPGVWAAWPLLVAGAALLLGWLEPGSVRSRRRRLVLEVPQALELVAACLAVGMPARQACAAVAEAFDGPVAEDLGQVLRAVELGTPDSEAWRALRGHPQLGPAAADLARSVESGTELVSALRGHAAAARERRRAALQQAARAVGVRSVLPLMTCFLPAFLLLGVVPTVASAVLHAFR
jgi:Flp pilus assembly protein TadB